MKKLIVFSVVVVLFMTGSCMTHITKAEAPIMTIPLLRMKKEWTSSTTKAMILFVSREYDYNAEQLICLARKESSLGEDKRCGDNGKSCFLFQIKEPTWNWFVKLMGRTDLVYSNYVDQTIVTGWAIEHGLGWNWPPFKHCK